MSFRLEGIKQKLDSKEYQFDTKRKESKNLINAYIADENDDDSDSSCDSFEKAQEVKDKSMAETTKLDSSKLIDLEFVN